MVCQIVPLMNQKEVEELILSHYISEAQTLTSDSEANLLRLKEIAGQLTFSEVERWKHIKEVFNKNNKLAGISKDNEIGQVIAQLAQFNDNLDGIKKVLKYTGNNNLEL